MRKDVCRTADGARERQAAVLPDTPQHRAFAARGYASFGTTGQVSIGTRMVASVEALHAAAPHLSATSEAGRAAQAVFALISRYNEGRATNGELDTVLKDLIFAMPPASHHRRTRRPLAGNQPAIERWAEATAAARELLTTVHDMDLQLELERCAAPCRNRTVASIVEPQLKGSAGQHPNFARHLPVVPRSSQHSLHHGLTEFT